MQLEKYPIPVQNVDYREVAQAMRYNIERLKEELTEHVDREIARFFSETGIDED